MTQAGNETDSTKTRSLRWTGRFSRTPRQLQQQQHSQEEERLDQKQLIPASDTIAKGASSDISSCMNTTDNISLLSDSSTDTPREACLSAPTVTKAQLTRNKDFHEHFKQVPVDDTLLHEFKCALQKEVLLQGRLYITKNYVCFKSNIFGYVTTLELKIEDIKHLDRVRTLRFMPRVLQLTMKNDDKHTFTSFLASLSARDEAYYSLMELWRQGHPPTASLSITSSASSSVSTILTATSPPPTTSPEKLPPTLILPNDTTNHRESDSSNSTAPVTIDTASSNKGAEFPSTTTPNSNHFKIFHRRRAQTVSAQNEPPNRDRSATSSSTPLSKNVTTNGHISWMDNRQEYTQTGPSRPTSLSPKTSTRSSSRSSILKKQKTPSLPPRPLSPTLSPPLEYRDSNAIRPLPRINITAMLAVGGFVLLLSHVFLTYEFYHVTQLVSIQQQQQQQQHQQQRPSSSKLLFHSAKAPQHKQQFQDTAWISGQLEDVKNQAQIWEQETLRQRKKLLDLIPS